MCSYCFYGYSVLLLLWVQCLFAVAIDTMSMVTVAMVTDASGAGHYEETEPGLAVVCCL